MTNDTIDNAFQASVTALREELASIQKLKDELEKMKANYRRREEIRESLIREEVKHELLINHKRRIRNSHSESYHELESMLSKKHLPDDLHTELEEKMDEAKDRFHEVQAEIEEEERKYVALVRSLVDELNALDIEISQ